jgi:hypothetical protein
MRAIGEPSGQAVARMRGRIGRGDAARLEAKRVRPFAQRF